MTTSSPSSPRHPMLDIVAALVAAGTLRGVKQEFYPYWWPQMFGEAACAAMFWYMAKLTGGGISEGFMLASIGSAGAAAGDVAQAIASSGDWGNPRTARAYKVGGAWANPLSDYAFMQGRANDTEVM